MLPVQLLELCFEGLIAVMVFGDGEGLGGDLQIGAEKANAVTVACGIDADADAVENGESRIHGSSP